MSEVPRVATEQALVDSEACGSLTIFRLGGDADNDNWLLLLKMRLDCPAPCGQ